MRNLGAREIRDSPLSVAFDTTGILVLNLLVQYDDAVWAQAVGEEGEDYFPIARFLEYTDPDLASSLLPISQATINFIVGLPCAFMSELRESESGEPGEFINVRFGRIKSARIVKGDIHYRFVIDRSFEDIQVGNRSLIEAKLNMTGWGLYRTHWAIKNLDVSDVLDAFNLDHNVAAQFPESDTSPDPAPRPEPSTDEIVEGVESVSAFLDEVLAYTSGADGQIFYRGHSIKKYKLEPSLFRKNRKGGYLYLENEDRMVREILTSHPSDFVDDRYMIDRLVRMQHYGLPTRLLDVTSNPLIALYFCCSGVKYDDDGEELDGEVILLTVPDDDIKYYDSDTVSCIANLSLASHAIKNKTDTRMDKESFNETEECKKLVHFIRSEKPYFIAGVKPEDLDRILFVKGRNSNSRISSQSGAFLLFGLDAVLPETGHSALTVKRIVVRQKATILKQLDMLNIKASTIFPGIEKSAGEIAKRFEVSA